MSADKYLIQQNLHRCFKIYNDYTWLLNSYVLDFFTENHWKKLKKPWQEALGTSSPADIAQLLNYNTMTGNRIWPLSLITLKSILTHCSRPRNVISLNSGSPLLSKHQQLSKIFWKNVKAKKRHEISVMSKVCYKSALETNCFYIVDIGSGLGHLSRILNYEYNLSVCAIEGQKDLTEQAKKYDDEFEKLISKKFGNSRKDSRTTHVNMRIEADITSNQFLHVIKNAFGFPDGNIKFGIVGLHPCGDLGATLLKLYKDCPNIAFINIVGCCYMKLTTIEIACHAIENYIEKLLNGEYWKLKIHAYRALIEKLIVSLWPELRHSALSNVKYTPSLNFETYCKKAIKKLDVTLPENQLKDKINEKYLLQWKKVVAFYSLRLLFAPFIESIILLDRLLFIEETGSKCEIMPLFDCKISPRCHIMTARK